MRVIKPPHLRPGDVIGVIAPASAPLDPSRIEAGVRYLEGLGYRVKVGRNVRRRHGHLAGTDAQRLADLNGMLADRQVRAIIALRGGYGCARLLPFVDYEALVARPKIVAGFSDLTALQLAIFRRTGLVTFSSPMLASDFSGKVDRPAEEAFWTALTSPKPVGRFTIEGQGSLRLARPGTARGRLLGGNLALVVSLLGTPYSPQYRGAVLVLEDVGEALHRVDRMLTQLRNAGVLEAAKGLVLGQFTDCGPVHPDRPHLKLAEIVAEVASRFPGPILEGLQYGHVRRKLTLPFGVKVRVGEDADGGFIEALESATE